MRHMKVGEILVRHGAIDLGQMQFALNRQRVTERRFGELLVELGMTTSSQVKAALAEQDWRRNYTSVR